LASEEMNWIRYMVLGE